MQVRTFGHVLEEVLRNAVYMTDGEFIPWDEFWQFTKQDYADHQLTAAWREALGTGGIIGEPDDPYRILESRCREIWVDDIEPRKPKFGPAQPLDRPLSDDEKAQLDAWINGLRNKQGESA